MSKVNRSIRLSQVVSNFGVGSIYDILGESLVLTDTRTWLLRDYRGQGREIKADRLIKNLRTQGFPTLYRLFEPVQADKSKKSGVLPYMRFPQWLFCSKCRHMKRWTREDEEEGKSPACQYCNKSRKLTPMRFITICEHGHMGDVNWKRWAHSQTTTDEQRTCQSDELEFESGFTKSGGLGSVAIRCRSCKAFRSLEGISIPDILKTIGVFCSGKQPWQAADKAENCDSRIHVVQRGAGNVYYPVIHSAITIPPESQYQEVENDITLRIKDHRYFNILKESAANPDLRAQIIPSMCADLSCTPEDIMNALGEGSPKAPEDSETDIQAEEWEALTTEIREADSRDKFVTRHIELDPNHSPAEAFRCIDKVVSVVKLREVRAMTGFHRYQPGENNPVYTDLGVGLDWLPAVEVYGEGVFFSLKESVLQQWETDAAVKRRVAVIKERAMHSGFAKFLPKVSARYILLHTLSHILIRRLGFECGYSSASLRERIYSQTPEKGTPRAGILIYTAAGDAEGTLGGLARQAEEKRFIATLLSGLQDAANCSADPICMESKGQGLDALNLAACHACSLVSETSCTSQNLLLDRMLVLGEGDTKGYFENLIQDMLDYTVNTTLSDETRLI